MLILFLSLFPEMTSPSSTDLHQPLNPQNHLQPPQNLIKTENLTSLPPASTTIPPYANSQTSQNLSEEEDLSNEDESSKKSSNFNLNFTGTTAGYQNQFSHHHEMNFNPYYHQFHPQNQFYHQNYHQNYMRFGGQEHQKLDNLGNLYDVKSIDSSTHQDMLSQKLPEGDQDLMGYKSGAESRLYETKPVDLDKNLGLNQQQPGLSQSSSMKPKIWSLADTAACKTPPLFNNNLNCLNNDLSSGGQGAGGGLLNNSGLLGVNNSLVNQGLGGYGASTGYGTSR